MEKIRLGKTELTVTRLGLGGVQLAKISTEEAVRVVRTGLDLGVNFLETARGYWDSEEKIGQAIAGRRDQVVIATKAGAADADGIVEQIDRSLMALGTDYIDLYQYHGCDTREAYEKITADGGVLEGLERAQQAGKIRSYGFSSHQLDLAIQIIDEDVFASAQLPISFMNTENHEKDLFGKARQHDVGLIAMKPFGGGRLGDARLCMGYVLSLPNVVAAVGVDRVEHVRELAALADDPPALTDDDRQRMRQISEQLGRNFCRACNYCQPCPEDIKIYQILWTPVYLAQMGIERIMTKERIEMIRQSANCTECRQCEERCPFNLQIVEGLKQTREMVEKLIAEHGLESP